MRVCKPPAPFVVSAADRVVFLAGSIDQGRADEWQTAIAAALGDLDVVVLNPRRDAWDAGWLQTIENPEFRGQVTWELDGLERADRIAVWFAPASQAPITLLRRASRSWRKARGRVPTEILAPRQRRGRMRAVRDSAGRGLG